MEKIIIPERSIGFKYTRSQELVDILKLNDKRLIKINPLEEGFYERVFNYELICGYCEGFGSIQKFCDAIREVKEEGVEPFFRPIMDPCLKFAGLNVITYAIGEKTVTGNTLEWWRKVVSSMPAVEGRHWKIGTEYHYYAFLVYLINGLVESGWSLGRAMRAVILDSKEFGKYNNVQITGRNSICGMYDIVSTTKMLDCTINVGHEYWLAGGYCDRYTSAPKRPVAIANLHHSINQKEAEFFRENSVGWLVLL